MALDLKARISLDGSGFQTGLNSVRTGIQNVKNYIAATFTTGAIASLSRATIAWASNLRDVSDALGVNVEWLQRMAAGAQLTGGKLEDLEKFLAEMNKTREDALKNPTGKNAAALGRLGFSGGDISGLSTQAFFDRIVQQFANGATAQLSNDVQEVGGKSARNLLAAFANQFASDTPILSEELVNQLDDIGDSFTALGIALKVGLAPAIIAVANAVQSVINQIKQFGAQAGGAAAKPLSAREKLLGLLSPQSLIAARLFSKDALDAVNSEAADQLNQADAVARAKAAAASARRRRELGAPLFDLEAMKDKAAKTTAPKAGDALVAVGNFLGARGQLQSIAERQLMLQTDLQRTYLPFLRQIAMSLATNSVGFPL